MDPSKLDSLLGELRGLLACCQEFVAFLKRTVAEAVQPAPVPRSLLESLRGGSYAHAMHELQAAYVNLEQVYLEESISKAISLDAVVLVRPFILFGNEIC
jgi:phage gp29-like protein